MDSRNPTLRQRIQDDLDCNQPEPRWPVGIGVLTICALRFAMPERLTIAPSILLVCFTLALLIPTSLAHRARRAEVNRWLTLILFGLLTVFLVTDLGLLIKWLLVPDRSHPMNGLSILRAAAALWLSNILVFALWYWRLDAGGPNARDLRDRHESGAFLFPPMTMQEEIRAQVGLEAWNPGFVDYLFLAFNTSTALSPADTGALAKWAKCLMMVQSLISLTILVFLAARAVNILQ